MSESNLKSGVVKPNLPAQVQVGNLVLEDYQMAEVANLKSLMEISSDPRLIVSTIADNIALPKDADVPVTPNDVLTVIRTANSMRLDPMLGGIWAFKDKHGKLACGVTKKGWQQALHAQPSYCGLDFRHGELKEKKVQVRGQGATTITYFAYVTCIVKKKLSDGTIGEFKGTAYFDEEFSGKDTWIQRPKRMLETRALTIASANAFGWGAYDVDELVEAEMATVEPKKTKRTSKVAEKAEKAIEANGEVEVEANVEDAQPSEKELLIEDMKKAMSHQELVSIFKSAPDYLKKDNDIIELGKALTQSFGE